MPSHPVEALSGYTLPGVCAYVAGKQTALADAPDPRVFLVEEGPERDALLAEDLMCPWSAGTGNKRRGAPLVHQRASQRHHRRCPQRTRRRPRR